ELRAEWPEHEGILLLDEAALLTAIGHAERSLELLSGMDAGKVERTEFDWQLGLAAAAAGDAALAERTFRRLLAGDPENPAIQEALGRVLLDDDRVDEAGALIEAAHRSAPANAAFLDALGWLRFREGDTAAARRALEESWRRLPTSRTGSHLLAVLQALGDERSEADLRGAMARRFPDAIDG